MPISIVWNSIAGPAGSARWVLMILDLSIGAVVLYELRGNARTHVFTQYTAVVYAGVSMVDSVTATETSRFDPGSTLALLVMLSVIHVATRPSSQKSTILLVSLTAVWGITTVLARPAPGSQELGLLFLALPGQMLVVWLVRQLIRDLGFKSRSEAKHARVQRALAGCSQALLKRGTSQPLTEALQALLGATDADYAYVDVNRTHPDGYTTWEIVADAQHPDWPGNDIGWDSGDYRGLESVEEILRAGRPATIRASELTGEIRESYLREGVKGELIAPIKIGDRWVGTIGYTDHTRPGTWTDIEIEGLMRAAEMVSAYWEREAAREGLMELAQAKDRFIASVSHELRTPLSAVVGFADELRRSAADIGNNDMEEMASLIYSQSMEVTQLVDDLLTAERATSGNLTVHPDSFDLLEECRQIIEWSEIPKKVSLRGDSVMAFADTLRTRQVVRNLLTNATKYGGEEIIIEVEARGAEAVVVVRDNGNGVRLGDVERIFDPYYRAEDGMTKPDSVGLGLAVARQLGRLMDGDVVYRRSNGWTAFELTVPLAPATREPESSTALVSP